MQVRWRAYCANPSVADWRQLAFESSFRQTKPRTSSAPRPMKPASSCSSWTRRAGPHACVIVCAPYRAAPRSRSAFCREAAELESAARSEIRASVARCELIRNGRALRIALEDDSFVRARLLEQGAQQLIVELVPALVGGELADQRRAQEVQVAERVQNFVTHELVAIAQTVLVDDAVIVHDDRVVHVRAERALACAGALEVLEEAERARAADLFQECLRREIHRHGL